MDPTFLKEKEINSTAAPLTTDELNSAKQELVNKGFLTLSYPKVTKQRKDPPINGQTYCLFSWAASPTAVPDKDGCYGIIKFRGAFPSTQEADEHAEYLIKYIDSYNEYLVTYTGQDIPLMKEMEFSETKEVDIRKKTDEVAISKIKQERDKEKREVSEVQERQRILMSETTQDEALEDLDYYTTLRVKRANLKLANEQINERINEAKKALKKVNLEIESIEKKNPEHALNYKDRYLKARDAAGLSDEQMRESNSLMKYL